MEPSFTDAFKPSMAFLEVTQELSNRLGLDAGKLADGAAVDYKDVRFWLQHHGAMDTDGIVLAVHAGDIPHDAQAAAYRQMLTHNALTPASRSGYFAVMPDTDTAMLCTRFDLADTTGAADAITAAITMTADALQHMADTLAGMVGQMDIADGTWPAPAT